MRCQRVGKYLKKKAQDRRKEENGNISEICDFIRLNPRLKSRKIIHECVWAALQDVSQ